ncbi:MAG: HNH endonuclease [Candidatus Woesearchaeota archaeon]
MGKNWIEIKLKSKAEIIYDELKKECGSLYADDQFRSRIKSFEGTLFYREVAKRCIYNLNHKKYPLPFNQYDVHHIDKNPTNDDLNNLAILTPEEHNALHLDGKIIGEKAMSLRKKNGGTF